MLLTVTSFLNTECSSWRLFFLISFLFIQFSFPWLEANTPQQANLATVPHAPQIPAQYFLCSLCTAAGCQNSPCSQPRVVRRKVSYKFNLELKGKAGFLWLLSPLQWRHEWEYWPAFLVQLHKPGHILSTGYIFQLKWNKTQPYLIVVAEASKSFLHPQVLRWFWAWISFPELWVIQ